MIHLRSVTSMLRTPEQQTGRPMDLTMDPLTDREAGTVH